MIQLRLYRPEDLPTLVQLFYGTVTSVCAGDYSAPQIRAWAAGSERLLNDPEFFSRLHTVVAETAGRIVGYGNMDRTGYLDHLFVHKDFQGKGAATAICDALEKYATSLSVPAVTVHASITARPFFAGRGYRTVKEQLVSVRGISMTNFAMELPLKQREKQ